MRYVMKQKLFSWGDDFYIRDEYGRDVFFVDGKALTLLSKLSFQDLQKRELAFIKQRFALAPTYEIYKMGQLFAVIEKELFTFFHAVFKVDVPGPYDYEAKGDFLAHEYVFIRNGYTVATVSKQWFSWTDTYGVDIYDQEDHILILASTVVIDMVCHDDNRY